MSLIGSGVSSINEGRHFRHRQSNPQNRTKISFFYPLFIYYLLFIQAVVAHLIELNSESSYRVEDIEKIRDEESQVNK
jgi:hypothetical protein